MASDEEFLPDDLPYPPDMLPGVDYFLEAFWELSTDRQIGMAVGPLPWSSIRRWLSDQNISDDEGYEIRRCFREMDAAYLNARTGKPPVEPLPTVAGARGPAAPMPRKGRKLSLKLFDAMFGTNK